MRRCVPAVVAGVIALASGCGGASGSLDAAGLAKEAETVSGLAAESSLLATVAARGDAGSSYVSVHAGELAGVAQKQATRLDAMSAPTALDADRRSLTATARRVESALRTLAAHGGDHARARAAQTVLEDAETAAKRLATP